MENRWLKYSIVLIISMFILICLSVSCLNVDSLPADILEGEWKWMYACYPISLIGFAVLILTCPQLLKASNRILQAALQVSGDPMILNVIGKNKQEMKNYESAEHWLMRATHRLPGRIYPYYLLAQLYADSTFYQREKLERMVSIVLEKEPKVQSTAIRQMRQKAKELLKRDAED